MNIYISILYRNQSDSRIAKELASNMLSIYMVLFCLTLALPLISIMFKMEISSSILFVSMMLFLLFSNLLIRRLKIAEIASHQVAASDKTQLNDYVRGGISLLILAVLMGLGWLFWAAIGFDIGGF